MKLMVIEGTDASGKQTQTELLVRALLEITNVQKVTFPDYNGRGCEPVKMYLEGQFGTEADKVNPYPVSVMYAVDRYASYKTKWGSLFKRNMVTVCDRYTTSNMIHQASKLETQEEKDSYIEWLKDMEYNKMGLPIPDIVIFLDMPTEYAIQLMADRKNKINGAEAKDIHENNHEYLKKSYENACEVAKKEGWKIVKCVKDGKVRTITEIHQEILKIAKTILL